MLLLLTLACADPPCVYPLSDCTWCPDTWEDAETREGDPDYGEWCESTTCTDSDTEYRVRTCFNPIGQNRYYYGPDGALVASFKGTDVDAGTCDTGEIDERWYGQTLCE